MIDLRLRRSVLYMPGSNLRALEKQALAGEVEAEAQNGPVAPALQPLAENLEDELAEAGRAAVARNDDDDEVAAARRALAEDLANDAEMSQYVMDDEDAEQFAEAEERVRKMQADQSGRPFSSTFSVRTKRAREAQNAAPAPTKRTKTPAARAHGGRPKGRGPK